MGAWGLGTSEKVKRLIMRVMLASRRITKARVMQRIDNPGCEGGMNLTQSVLWLHKIALLLHLETPGLSMIGLNLKPFGIRVISHD